MQTVQREAKQSILYFKLAKNMCGNTYFGTKIHHIEAGYYIGQNVELTMTHNASHYMCFTTNPKW